MRNFFYRNNDIIVVLIILVVAGFLIYNRIGVIMDYPKTVAEQQAKAQAEQQIEDAAEDTETTDSDSEE